MLGNYLNTPGSRKTGDLGFKQLRDEHGMFGGINTSYRYPRRGAPRVFVANLTNRFVIQNKGYLLLTVAYITDARKKVLTSQYITPDELISADANYDQPDKDPTVTAAAKWLSANSDNPINTKTPTAAL